MSIVLLALIGHKNHDGFNIPVGNEKQGLFIPSRAGSSDPALRCKGR